MPPYDVLTVNMKVKGGKIGNIFIGDGGVLSSLLLFDEMSLV